MTDWADDKAREWLDRQYNIAYERDAVADPMASLAALLREVAGTHIAHIQWTDPGRDHLLRKDVLAEVRGVIDECERVRDLKTRAHLRGRAQGFWRRGAIYMCRAIRAGLEKL